MFSTKFVRFKLCVDRVFSAFSNNLVCSARFDLRLLFSSISWANLSSNMAIRLFNPSPSNTELVEWPPRRPVGSSFCIGGRFWKSMGHFEESSSFTTNEYIHFFGDSPTMGWSLCVDDSGGGCPCVFSSVSLTYTTVPGSTKVHQFQQAHKRMMSSLSHCGTAIQTSIVAPCIKQPVASVWSFFLRGLLVHTLDAGLSGCPGHNSTRTPTRLCVKTGDTWPLLQTNNASPRQDLRKYFKGPNSKANKHLYSCRYVSDARKKLYCLVVCLLSTTVLQPR